MNRRIKKKLLKRHGYLKYSNYRFLFKPSIEFIIHENGKCNKMTVAFSQLMNTKMSKNRTIISEEAFKDSLKRFNFDNCNFLGEMEHPIKCTNKEDN